MPEGKYFYATSAQTGQVLSMKGNEVILFDKVAESDDTQLWYECQVTGTIRNKMSDLCLHLNEDGFLEMSEYIEDNKKQEWWVAKDRIQNKHDSNQVLQVDSDKITADTFTNADNQKWTFEYPECSYFHIVSMMHGKVVQINKGKREPGAKLVMGVMSEEPHDEQLWFEDKHSIIKSKLNRFVLECVKAEIGEQFKMEPFSPGQVKQLWTRYGKKIVSRVHPSQVLAINKKNKDTGAKVVVAKYKEEDHQHWDFKEIS